jgi:hypothetical protein
MANLPLVVIGDRVATLAIENEEVVCTDKMCPVWNRYKTLTNSGFIVTVLCK